MLSVAPRAFGGVGKALPALRAGAMPAVLAALRAHPTVLHRTGWQVLAMLVTSDAAERFVDAAAVAEISSAAEAALFESCVEGAACDPEVATFQLQLLGRIHVRTGDFGTVVCALRLLQLHGARRVPVALSALQVLQVCGRGARAGACTLYLSVCV